MQTETVTTQRDAQGGHCATCDQYFNVTTCPYWAWTKSVWMHRQGTGHTVTLYRIAAIQPTVTTDFQTRVIALPTRAAAVAEAAEWTGFRTRIIERNGVANLLIAA